jgi:hypothetical protein
MKFIFSLAFMCMLGSLCAQQPAYQWSPVMDYKYKSEKIDDVLSYNDKALFLLRKAGEMPSYYYVEKYSNNLSLAYQAEMKLEPKGVRDRVGYLSSAVCNDVAYGFFYHFEDESSTYKVIACQIDDKGKLGEEIVLGKDNPEKFGKAPDYKLITSPDGSKIAAIGLLPFEKESIEKWHVLIYEVNGFKKLLDKTVESLVPRERFEINDLMLGNSGNLQVFKMWDVKKEGKYSTIVTVKTDGSVRRTDLDLGIQAISYHKVFVNKSGHAAVIGFLNPDEKDWKRISSHFYISVDENGAKVNNVIEPLGEQVLSKVFFGLTKGKAEKEDQCIKEYEFVDFLENDKGEITVFLEYFSQTSKSIPNTDPAKLLSNYDRTHKALIMIRLDKTGRKVWTEKLEKKQNYVTMYDDKYWGGVVPFMVENQTYIVWNNINFPEIPGKLAQATQGWYDNNKQKHFVYEEYGNRAVYGTCLSGVAESGLLMFADQPVPNAMPLVGMYKDAVYAVTFSSRVFARYRNSVVLIMEMPAGINSGAAKYQLCKLTVNE